MDKLVESLRVLLEMKEMVCCMWMGSGCGRRNMQAVWKHCEKYWTRTDGVRKKIDAVRKLLDEALEK